jgi:phosphinothricin acetyltransferase
MTTRLRLATEDDAAQIQAIYAPIVRDTPISFELEPPSVDEMRQRIARTVPRFPWVVCVREATVLGYAYASAHRERAAYQWSVDASVYIHEAARGKGIGRALYTALFPLVARQGFFNVYAGITLPNPASVGLHEAMGFRPVGIYRAVGYKLGAWHDVGWWDLSLHDDRFAPPELPLPLSVVRESPAWKAALDAGLATLRP